MKSLKEAVGSLTCEQWAIRMDYIKARDRAQRRNGRQAYIFPGMKAYPRPSTHTGEAAMMEKLARYPQPEQRVRAGAAWKAWQADPTTATYVAAFCEANHLKHGV